MHDAPLGPGWWQSDDGQWYPPNIDAPSDMSWARLQAAPGWYPDSEPGWYRWWDGGRWTLHRRLADLHLTPRTSDRSPHLEPVAGRPSTATRYTTATRDSQRERPLLAPRPVGAPSLGGRIAIGFLGLLVIGGLALSSSEGDEVAAGGAIVGDEVVAAGEVAEPSTGDPGDRVDPAPDPVGTAPEEAVTTGDPLSRPAAEERESATTTAPSVAASIVTTVVPSSAGAAPPSMTAPDPVVPESGLEEFDPPPSALVQESGTVPPPPSARPVAPTTVGGACHPAYSPCIEFLVGDALDCGDLRPDQKPVTILDPNEDPYNLDLSRLDGSDLDGGDRDGTACEAG